MRYCVNLDAFSLKELNKTKNLSLIRLLRKTTLLLIRKRRRFYVTRRIR
jgi:hypothetical protein